MIRVASLSEIPEGTAKHVEIDGDAIAIINAGDHLYAVSDVCSHEYALLSEGEVDADRGTIECPKHGSLFDYATGAAVTLPAVLPVRTYGVRVQGDDVFVEALERREMSA